MTVAVLADVLRARGIDDPEAAIAARDRDVAWPGRLERLDAMAIASFCSMPRTIPAGARALAAYLRESGWTDAALVFGAMADKNAAGMLRRALRRSISAIVCTTAPAPGPRAPSDLAGIARASFVEPTGSRRTGSGARASALRRHARRDVLSWPARCFLIGPLRGILR